ncbi:hypothetical protein HYD73_01205 [Mycoplasmopsis bovis]|nr:hypothetical protein HYD73_01205 [Mycoplasmopsis bovis]
MFKVLCSNYKGLTYEKKINVNRGGGLVFASSFPMIAASCENKNPTDESIINNTTPQTQGNQNDQEDKSKEKEQKDDPSGSDSSSSNTSPQTQGNQNDQEDKSKEKEQKDDPKWFW